MASRLSSLSPNLTSRFTPGTLISSYEVFEACAGALPCPSESETAEAVRSISDLRACDKGGMMFQPEPGVYEKVHEIDFTSLYPSIIVKYRAPPAEGLHEHRAPSLLSFSIETKRLKKVSPDYAGTGFVSALRSVTDCSSMTMRFAA